MFFFYLLKPIKNEKVNASCDKKKDDNDSMLKELLDINDTIGIDML